VPEGPDRGNILNELKRLIRAERGITGLETAIILIAFVVVAAVFAYTVISAGMCTTQKSQQTVHSGLGVCPSNGWFAAG